MKRYIHAAFDPSMPDWLQNSLKSDSYGRNELSRGLREKKNIALDRAQFLDYYTNKMNALPIYLLKVDYGTEVYVPGINDDKTESINGRYRKLGSIAKSKLPDMAVDIAYIDLDDPNNFFEVRDKYRDPRYSYHHNSRGEYAGQYRRQNYLGDGKYEDAGWSPAGTTPRNESRARDKSGYKVPTPESRIAEYYSKFPEKITEKVDRVYDRLIEVRQELHNYDLKSIKGDRRSTEPAEEAYRSFAYAIREYKDLLSLLGEEGTLLEKSWDPSYSFKQFSGVISNINDYLDDVERKLGI